jgi:hypothetical protein
MISELTVGEYQLTFGNRILFGGEEFKAFWSAASLVRSKLGGLSIWCCIVGGNAETIPAI